MRYTYGLTTLFDNFGQIVRERTPEAVVVDKESFTTHYWLPLAIGLAAVLLSATIFVVIRFRRKRRKAYHAQGRSV